MTIHNEKTAAFHNHGNPKDHAMSSGRQGRESRFTGHTQGFIIWGPEPVPFIFALYEDTNRCVSNCRICAYGMEIRAKPQILLLQNAHLLIEHSVLLPYHEYTWLVLTVLRG